MKKLLLIVALVALSVGTYAQKGTKSALLKAGYQTEAERLGLGLQARYGITDNLRLAPEIMFFFPKNRITGFDLNMDLHYIFNVKEGLDFYPLAGLAWINNLGSGQYVLGIEIPSNSTTDFGWNFGAGVDYHLSENSFLNAEFKYTLSDGDHALFAIGYGVKF